MMKKTDFRQYINREINCSCGRTHYSSVRQIEIGEGTVRKLPACVKGLGFGHPFLVADKNTWEAAGRFAADALSAEGISFDRIVLRDEEPVPDEAVIGEIMTAFPLECDLIIAVGSGTINDLCKFVSHRLGREYIIFASAPSMDGFVSIGAALMLHHMKTTIDCHGPLAVISDVDILAQAPMRLISAGLGDTLGKYTCLLDWKLAHLITGEYYCGESVRMVETALRTVTEQSGRVAERDPEAIKAVTEALVLTGIAMSYAGNSRPASGCEHHLSHYWEMKSLMAGKMPALHGTQVGVGMILALRLYHALAKETPDFEAAAAKDYNKEEWAAGMRKLYGIAADGIIALEEKAGKNDIIKRNKRIAVMREHWPRICAMIEESLPATEDMESLLTSLGAPVNPEQMGLSPELAAEGVEAAKEVRDRYTLLQILWDLGLTEKYASAVRDI